VRLCTGFFFALLDRLKGGQFTPGHGRKRSRLTPVLWGREHSFCVAGGAPKRAALCAERGSAPITPVRKKRIRMTDRKRTTAIQVRVTEQEKRKLERQARQCGLSLSGYLRRVGAGKPAATFPRRRFRDLYRQVNGLRDDPTTQPMERTAAQLDELAGLILTAYTSGGVDDGDH